MSLATAKLAATLTPTETGAALPKSAEMNPGPGFRIRQTIERPPASLIAMFRDFQTPDISDILNRLYTMSPDIHNVVNEATLVGPACTVKVFPGDNLMVHKALDVAKPGDVVVIDTSGSQCNAVLGDLVASKAKHRGIAGFIVDGLVRDLPALKEVGLPVFARGVTPFGPLHRGPGEINYAVSCGGIVVNPGDIVVADASGIAIIRREVAEETVMRLRVSRARLDQYIRDVKAGRFSNAWVDRQLAEDRCLIEE
jgi:RraA family protein